MSQQARAYRTGTSSDLSQAGGSNTLFGRLERNNMAGFGEYFLPLKGDLSSLLRVIFPGWGVNFRT
jgi:hypothetical protein